MHGGMIHFQRFCLLTHDKNREKKMMQAPHV